jgi:protein-S-isoprenylcysteine O-methyltransferase Ste14
MSEIVGKATIHPALFFSGKCAGFVAWVFLGLHFIGFRALPILSPMSLFYPGCAILIAGIIVSAISLLDLGDSTTLGIPAKETRLKTAGIYGFSRNPMYVGFGLITTASALLTMNAAVIAMAIFSISIYHKIILGEEEFLKKRFGREYSDYYGKVRRYL